MTLGRYPLIILFTLGTPPREARQQSNVDDAGTDRTVEYTGLVILEFRVSHDEICTTQGPAVNRARQFDL